MSVSPTLTIGSHTLASMRFVRDRFTGPAPCLDVSTRSVEFHWPVTCKNAYGNICKNM